MRLFVNGSHSNSKNVQKFTVSSDMGCNLLHSSVFLVILIFQGISQDVVFGRHGNKQYKYFKGEMDEVCFLRGDYL